MQLARSLRALAVCAAVLALAAPAAAAAHSSLSTSAWRTQRPACAHPRRAHAAACQALRLVRVGSTRTARGEPNREKGIAGLSPQQLHAAYELPAETPQSATQTIALVDAFNDPTAEADLAVYDKQFGLPECTKEDGCLRILNQNGQEAPLPKSSGVWAPEVSLDLQTAHGICQSCHILLVEADSEEFSDLGAAAQTAFAAGATVISNSYGSYEEESTELAAEEERSLNADYEHPRTVVVASTGDCGYRQQNPEGVYECLERPSAVSFPADSPDVVAAGGTEINDEDGSWTSTVWEGSGGGCSSVFSAQSWQSAVSDWSQTGCGSERLDADVSSDADPYSGVAVYIGTPEAKGGRAPGWQVYGGTSLSSPTLAGEFALAGGARGISYPAQTLYGHLGQAKALYDVTSGSNGSCGGALSCTAGPGYDGPSGVGSPVGLAAFAPTAGAPSNTSAPAIEGAAEVSETLKALPGSWSVSPTTVLYQWEDCSAGAGCVPIQGATQSSYTVRSSDSGSRIRVMETVADAAGYAPPAFSGETATVGVANPPTVTGLSPKKGTEGTIVTISGTNFTGVSAVTFGSAAAKSYHVISEGEISAEAPAGTGTVLVTVTARGGSSESQKRPGKARFKYVKARR